MDADVLTTRVADGIAVITLGTARRIYIDQETSDALFEALNTCAGDADIRVVIVTGAAPGIFVRHYSIPELIRFAESVRATGREWPEARFIDGPTSVCESMPKALDRAMEIARHLSSFTPESLASIKRLVRGATETPLTQGLLLERRLFMKLCLSDAALSRMRAYDEQDSASPSRVT